MRPSVALVEYRDRIWEIVLSHRMRAVRVFGSVLRGEDVEGSDLDLLVEPSEESTLFDVGAIQYELSELLNLHVDVLTPAALPNRFRDQVLRDAKPV